MAKRKHLDHALHNEKVCRHLNKTPDYLDWVITTAFYSAMHFVSHKIFPFEIENNGKKLNIRSFKEYCMYKKDSTRKHNQLAKLVEERLEDIADAYNHLKDASWTARYHQYKYDREISALAVRRVKEIKEACVDDE